MNSMVSARVPTELRDQVNERLKSKGYSPTELIKSAYEYFLKSDELPSQANDMQEGKRKLDDSRLSELRASLNATTFPVPESFFGDMDYKQMLERELLESYEALA